MLTGYFDESGHESKSHVIIAGFVGNKEQWDKFGKLWREGLGKRSGLHMGDLRWSKAQTEGLLKRLGPIPAKCSLEAVMGGVRVSDYEDLIDGSPWEKLAKGYFLALYPLVIQLLRWVPMNERIELIFDKQEQYEPIAHFIFNVAAKLPEFVGIDGRPKLAKWSYIPRNDTMLTQPADYYAFALAHYLKGKDEKKIKWCMPILESNPEPIGNIYTRDQIRKNIKTIHDQMDKSWPNQSPIPLRGWRESI